MAHIPENGKDGYFVIALLAKLGKDIITAVLRTARLRLGLPGCPHSARARLNLGPTWPGAAQPPAPPLTRLLARALAAGFAATTNESPSTRELRPPGRQWQGRDGLAPVMCVAVPRLTTCQYHGVQYHGARAAPLMAQRDGLVLVSGVWTRVLRSWAVARSSDRVSAFAALVPRAAPRLRAGPCSGAAGNSWDRNPCLCAGRKARQPGHIFARRAFATLFLAPPSARRGLTPWWRATPGIVTLFFAESVGRHRAGRTGAGGLRLRRSKRPPPRGGHGFPPAANYTHGKNNSWLRATPGITILFFAHSAALTG